MKQREYNEKYALYGLISLNLFMYHIFIFSTHFTSKMHSVELRSQIDSFDSDVQI